MCASRAATREPPCCSNRHCFVNAGRAKFSIPNGCNYRDASRLRIVTIRHGLKVFVIILPCFGHFGWPFPSQDGPPEIKSHLESGLNQQRYRRTAALRVWARHQTAGRWLCTGGGRISRWQMGSAKLFAALCALSFKKIASLRLAAQRPPPRFWTAGGQRPALVMMMNYACEPRAPPWC